MKKNRLFNLALLLVTVPFAQESFAQTTLEGHSDSGNSMVFSSTGNIFSTGLLDGDYRTWHLPDGALARLGKGSIGEGDRAVAWSPDGTRLAVASSIGIWLYDTDTGAEVVLLTGHTDDVISVAFSPDGQTLASGSHDRTVKLWDVDTGQEKASLTGHRSVVLSVAFSPDGQTLASGSVDDTIRLWDVGTGRVIRTLTRHTASVWRVSFSPDGQTLASGSDDGTVLLWDMSPYVTSQPPTPDFDGDGIVGFGDFVLFAAQFGLSQGDEEYGARYDLDGNGAIGFSDIVIVDNAFGNNTGSA